jgi:hypothetical protein
MKTLRVGETHHHEPHRARRSLAHARDDVRAYDPEIGRRHLAELDPIVFDPASGLNSDAKCNPRRH